MLLHHKTALAVALAVTAGWPAISRAGDVTVENYSNENVYVAISYGMYKGTSDLYVEGWFMVAVGDKRTFSLADADAPHLRIQNQRGGEITFPRHQRFQRWPLHSARFTVSKEGDDATIRNLRWGNNLENNLRANFNGSLPTGWRMERFFAVSGNARLEIRP
jgi:hypothetical protein